jgi:hypothetical protein
MNPVTEALAAARLRQLNVKDDAMSVIVSQVVGPIPKHARPKPEAFNRWCERKGTTALPASTSAVALFVLEHQKDGVEALLGHLADISGSHCDANLADPTTSQPVTAALNRITKVEPPRSWAKTEWARFWALPYGMQVYVKKRETERDAGLRRAQDKLAEERKQIANPKVENESPIHQNANVA